MVCYLLIEQKPGYLSWSDHSEVNGRLWLWVTDAFEKNILTYSMNHHWNGYVRMILLEQFYSWLRDMTYLWSVEKFRISINGNSSESCVMWLSSFSTSPSVPYKISITYFRKWMNYQKYNQHFWNIVVYWAKRSSAVLTNALKIAASNIQLYESQ